MIKASLWTHWLLAIYLWLISFVSLGRWNAQHSPHLFAAMRAGHVLSAGETGFFLFVTLPAILFTFARSFRSSALVWATLVFDLIWFAMQVQSWWVPYLFGTAKPWQIAYAKGATTKVLPSFGKHVAPDGMHLLISILLVAAIWTASISLGVFRTGSKNAPPEAHA